MEKELFSQMTKIPRIRIISGFSYSGKKLRGKNVESRNKHSNIYDKFSSYKNDDCKNRAINLSFGGVKKISKESGFGY